jgi:peptidoglycan/LPS O-acetylase OafA/YrhL
VFSVALRWRRSSGIERLQLRWFLAAVVAVAIGFLLTFHNSGANAAFGFTVSLIPIACGVAILRYRLYDIDRIISRAASYAIVTGVLLVTYALVVTSVTRLMPDASTLAVAAATLSAAALARPLYRRVQQAVDRRFNRARYDAQHTVDDFGARLRHEVDTDLVAGDLLGVVRLTLQPAGVALWLRGRS